MIRVHKENFAGRFYVTAVTLFGFIVIYRARLS